MEAARSRRFSPAYDRILWTAQALLGLMVLTGVAALLGGREPREPAHVAADGVLRLKVPAGFANADLDVTLEVSSAGTNGRPPTPEELGWPPGFFEETFGAWEGEPLERPDQGEFPAGTPFA